MGDVWAEAEQWQLGWVVGEKRLGEGGDLKAFWVLAGGAGACGIGRAGGRGWAWW